MRIEDAAANLGKAVATQQLDAARFIIWDADLGEATFEGLKWSSGAISLRQLPDGWPFGMQHMPTLQPPEFVIWLDTEPFKVEAEHA